MADEQLKALVVEAMFKALDDKKREELIKHALETLIKPTTNVYGSRQTSPLEDAFNIAIHSMARDVVRDMLATDEVRDRIRALAATAFEKMVTDKDRLANEMANAMVDAITKAGNY